MIDEEIIKAKLTHMQKSIRRLHEKKGVSQEEFQRSPDLQDIVIHNLQLVIQGAIDIASHIISDEGWRVPGSLAGLFDVLSEKGVISEGMRETMKSMVGFRNIIIHEYEEIDLAKVYEILTEHLSDFDHFLKEIVLFAKL